MKTALHEFKERKKLFLLALLELVLAVLAIVSFLNLVGFNVFRIIEARCFSFALSQNPIDFAIFALSLALLLIVFFAIQKLPVLYSAQQKAVSEIKLSAKQKIASSKTDPRIPALLLLELIVLLQYAKTCRIGYLKNTIQIL